MQINWSKCILYSSWLSCFVQNCQIIYHLRRHKNCRLKQTLLYVSIGQRIKTKSFMRKKVLVFYLRSKSYFLTCQINVISITFSFFFHDLQLKFVKKLYQFLELQKLLSEWQIYMSRKISIITWWDLPFYWGKYFHYRSW